MTRIGQDKYRELLAANMDMAAWGSDTNPLLDFYKGNFNVLIETSHKSEEPYITQRPAIEIVSRASDAAVDAKGRGIHYWEATGDSYIINNDTIYTNSYSSVLGTISAGSEKVTIIEMVSYLVIIDHENNEGWYIDTGNILTQIIDPDFPSTVVGGGAMLDQYVFVMDEAGTIYQSNLNDPVNWNALDIITAERDPDKGVALVRHYDHLVALGTKTIEFFYDAGNPQGSVLARRADISYRIGCYDANSVVSIGDQVFFVGVDASGGVGFYSITDFKVEKLSNNSYDALLTSAKRASDVYSFIVSASYINGHLLVYINPVFKLSTGVLESSGRTLVYDAFTSFWTDIGTLLYNVGFFAGPLNCMHWADRTNGGIRQAAGIMANGDIIRYRATSEPMDGVTQDNYVEDDYVEQQDDYVASGISTLVPITCAFVTKPLDFITGNNKFMTKFELVGDFATSQGTGFSAPFLVTWTDDDLDFSELPPFRELYLLPRRKLTRCGYFNRRRFYVAYTGEDRFRLTAFDADLRSSLYA